jgi:hypothetical protein
VTTNDDDNLEQQLSLEQRLTPAERQVYQWIKTDPTRPFCSKDIMELPEGYAEGTARNIILKLKHLRLIKPYCRDKVAFYVLESTDLGKAKKPVTIYRMGGNGLKRIQINVISFLESLPWEELCKIHDVHLKFMAEGLYDILAETKLYTLDAFSKDISVGSFSLSRYRVLNVLLHRNGSVSFYMGCSNCPLELSIGEMISLSSFLGGIRKELFLKAKTFNPSLREETLPNVEDWIVVQWHYGRDSAQEFSGEPFNMSFKMWCGELARIYVHLHDKTSRLRLEVVQNPEKSLQKAVAEKLNLCCGRCKECLKPS